MDPTCSLEKSLRKSSVAYSKSSMSWEPGFLNQFIYEKALAIALQDKGFRVQCQHPLRVHFRQRIVGEFYTDLVVEGKIIVELKAAKAIAPEHQTQIINYQKATGTEVGLLINFGNPKLEYKRFTRHK